MWRESACRRDGLKRRKREKRPLFIKSDQCLRRRECNVTYRVPGHIADAWRDWDSAHCADEYGNHARLQALSLSLSEEAVDVRCWLAKKCRVRDASARPCAQYPYDDAMARVAADPELATRTGHVAKENFTLFKYVLNLPGSSSGSYSRNLNHLWFLQSVVLLWKAPFVEWYYPALRNGETHVDVDHRSLADAVRELEAHPEKAAAILKNAKRVDAELVCPNCIARYLRLAIERVRKRFQLSKVLDDPCAAREFFARTLNCSRLDLFEVLPTARQPGAYDIDGRRNLMTTAYPHFLSSRRPRFFLLLSHNGRVNTFVLVCFLLFLTSQVGSIVLYFSVSKAQSGRFFV